MPVYKSIVLVATSELNWADAVRVGYSEAKKALNELIKNEKVIVEPVATDDYGRVVAKVKKGNRLLSTLMKDHQKK